MHMWTDSLFVPAYVAALSAVILFLQCIWSVHEADEEPEWPGSIVLSDATSTARPVTGFMNEFKSRIQSLGGTSIFFYKLFRLVGVLTLLGLTIVTLVADKRMATSFQKSLENGGQSRYLSSLDVSNAAWPQLSLCLTYVRTYFLALLTFFDVVSKSVTQVCWHSSPSLSNAVPLLVGATWLILILFSYSS